MNHDKRGKFVKGHSIGARYRWRPGRSGNPLGLSVRAAERLMARIAKVRRSEQVRLAYMLLGELGLEAPPQRWELGNEAAAEPALRPDPLQGSQQHQRQGAELEGCPQGGPEALAPVQQGLEPIPLQRRERSPGPADSTGLLGHRHEGQRQIRPQTLQGEGPGRLQSAHSLCAHQPELSAAGADRLQAS